MKGPDTFEFLGQTRHLRSIRDWDDPSHCRLWRYNLHYFDDLCSIDASLRSDWHESLIERWVKENPAYRGSGWEPYPTSLRIVNWIKWIAAGNDMPSQCQQSLAVQADWLSRNIEWHLLGNHLFANAKALLFAGLYFSGVDADRWLDVGTKIMVRELDEQVLADGGHFELSPMYHSIALNDVLDIMNADRHWPGVLSTALLSKVDEAAPRMIHWMQAMCHPDREIALFNDSALGIAPSPDELLAYARRLQLEISPPVHTSQHLANSGYVRAVFGDAVLLCDVGRIGPDYLPGHAHADNLTFELSLFKKRWIVDSGCSTYDVGEERLRQRSTAAHNTVTVDNTNSSDVWAGFRVGARAKPCDVEVNIADDLARIDAAHDGYMRLAGAVMHRRRWEIGSGNLRIHDELSGRFDTATARFLLHPDVHVECNADSASMSHGGHRAVLTIEGGELRLRKGSWHPRFGVTLSTHRLDVVFHKSSVDISIAW